MTARRTRCSPSRSRKERRGLAAWVARGGAVRTIAIGLGYGISALFICEALLRGGDPGARHVAIDPNQESHFSNCALQFLGEAGVRDLVEFRSEESQVALPNLISEGRTFDLAFVDGNHRFDGVFVDLAVLRRLVRPGGVVFVDDYQLPAIEKAVSFFVSNLDWTVEEISPPDELHQWAVLPHLRIGRLPTVPTTSSTSRDARLRVSRPRQRSNDR